MAARFYLNFHGLGAPHAAIEPDERPYWLSADAFRAIIARAAAQGPAIGITFDDGNQSDIDIALPALQAAGLTAAFFIPTDRIGAPLYLSADQIRALHGAGMRIGSHGRAHVRWTALDDAQLRDEIFAPLGVLSEIVGAPVTTVGVPFGAYDDRVLQRLAANGVTQVFTSDGGPCLPDAFLVPRTSVRNDMALESIAAMMNGPHDPARFYLRAAKRVARRALRPLRG